jgi:hypothetical protein
MSCATRSCGALEGSGWPRRGRYRSFVDGKAAVETLATIGADRKHLGAEIGTIAVLHTWGQNLQHHPHLHCTFRVLEIRAMASAGSPFGRCAATGKTTQR